MDLINEMRKIFPEIEKLFSDEDMDEFLSCDIYDLSDYHFGVGAYIRNHMLIEGKEIYSAFKSYGIVQKDDASGMILEEFYRYMKEKRSKKE